MIKNIFVNFIFFILVSNLCSQIKFSWIPELDSRLTHIIYFQKIDSNFIELGNSKLNCLNQNSGYTNFFLKQDTMFFACKYKNKNNNYSEFSDVVKLIYVKPKKPKLIKVDTCCFPQKNKDTLMVSLFFSLVTNIMPKNDPFFTR